METHSSILAWRTPWTEEPGGGYSPWGHKKPDMTERLSTGLRPQICSFLEGRTKTRSLFNQSTVWAMIHIKDKEWESTVP